MELAIWYPHDKWTDAEAADIYAALRAGECEIEPHPALLAFFNEFKELSHTQLGGCKANRQHGCVFVDCPRRRLRRLRKLAQSHGLAAFDAGAGEIYYDYEDPPRRRWWPW